MATTTAEVANKALGHLGVVGRITTLSTDTTTEGKACRQFFTDAVHETLRAHEWRCATKQATLTLMQSFAQSDTREWLYQYREPGDCLQPRRLLWQGVRAPRADQIVPFQRFADVSATTYDAGTTYTVGQCVLSSSVWYVALRTTLADTPASSPSDWQAMTVPPAFLHTDLPNAVLEYTMDLTDPTRFDRDLEAAVAAYLAVLIAPHVTVNGSAESLIQSAAAKWTHLLATAVARDAQGRKPDLPPVSGYQAVRGYRRAF